MGNGHVRFETEEKRSPKTPPLSTVLGAAEVKVNTFRYGVLTEEERMKATVVCLHDHVTEMFKPCLADCGAGIVLGQVGFDMFGVKGQFAVHVVTHSVSID